MIARTKLRINAHKKPLTVKPGTIFAVNKINKALITKVKRPRVIIFIGKVRITRIGLRTALAIPKTSAAAKAVVRDATCTPGKK